MKAFAWWLCQDCGHAWRQRIFLRVQGKGCEVCREKTYTSVAEDEIAAFCKSLGYIVQRGNRIVLGDRQEIDIYLPELRFGIEYHGLWYHSEKAGKTPEYHYDKWMRAQQAGITLVQIWEDDWTKDAKAVKQRLQDHLAYAARGDGTAQEAPNFLRKHANVTGLETTIELKNELGLDSIMRDAGFEVERVLPAMPAYVNRVKRLFERQAEDAGMANRIWDAGSVVYNRKEA